MKITSAFRTLLASSVLFACPWHAASGATPPPSNLRNISTRSFVQTGDNVIIGGFVVQGIEAKKVMIRAVGPSLAAHGITSVLNNPSLTLHDASQATIARNDDWQVTEIGGVITADQVAEIQSSQRAPNQAAESVIIATLQPGAYTAIIRGVNGSTGIGLVEVYDLALSGLSSLSNISTRSAVGTGDNVMIGGFVVEGTEPKTVVIRAIGPSLSAHGITNPLSNPSMTLHDASQAIIARNDDWQVTQTGGVIATDQVSDIQSSQRAPGEPAESAIVATLQPGAYTAVVRGVSGTGIGLVEVFEVARPGVATIAVRTFLPSDGGNSATGPAGAIVKIDGAAVATTDAAGRATVHVPVGSREVAAELRPSNGGDAFVTLVEGEIRPVDIILDDGKEIPEDTTLRISELTGKILNRSFTSFTLRFTAPDGSTAPLKSFDFVTLEDAQGDKYLNVTHLFGVEPNGTVAVKDASALRTALLARPGAIHLTAHGSDEAGGIHHRTVELFVSSYTISGKLAAPPSNPSLNTGGISITGKILNTDLVFSATSDANGNFSFPLLPAGNFEFTSETQQNGIYYYGQGTLVLNGNKTLQINMLATTDLVNGVAPFTVQSAGANIDDTSSGSESASSLPDREAREMRSRLNSDMQSGAPAVVNDDPSSVTVSVTAGAQNSPVSKTATLYVPQGTQTITLSYNVQTDEYPYYVKSNSIYNDTWRLAVRGGSSGQELIPTIIRQINSQLQVAPVWQTNGTTGALEQKINVQSLTAAGATNLILFASTTNVGDSALPTRVTATLGADPSVKINKATPDSTVPFNFHSIPRRDATNTFNRVFTLDISKPQGSTVKRVIATLLGPDELMTLVDEAPGGTAVQEINATTLRVNVALKPKTSEVDSQPPPAHKLKLRFKVVVDVNGVEVADEKESGERRGLWRMPDGLARYSPADPSLARDVGGDDWCSRGTYYWLLVNSGLFSGPNRITSINDISGEHGRDIKHPSSHFYGTDIDAFHFYTFPGGHTGGANYRLLVEAVKLAVHPTNGQTAKERVTAWVMATRSGLDTLAAKTEVKQLIYANGWGFSDKHRNEVGLNNGWARQLIRTGKTSVGGTVLDLETGDWTNSVYIPADDHNDHVHIALLRPALGEE